jgi:hypothetical protein
VNCGFCVGKRLECAVVHNFPIAVHAGGGRIVGNPDFVMAVAVFVWANVPRFD